jgi:hypothetical protein
MQNQYFAKARFEHYSRKLAEYGIRRGIVLKSIEENLRKDIISLLTLTNSKNTVIANIIGKNEKTVRNLKRQFSGEQVILKRNRSFHINNIIHELTYRTQQWISLNTIYDEYLQNNMDDDEFDERILQDTLTLLVKSGSIIEQRQKYTAFYRSSCEKPVTELREKSNRAKYETVLAIAQEFDNMVDYLGTHPDRMNDIKFVEYSGTTLPDVAIQEINEKMQAYADRLVAEYEQNLEDAGLSQAEGKNFRMIIGIAPSRLDEDVEVQHG